MSGRTEVDGDNILDGSVQRKDIDITTVGQSLVTEVEALDGLEMVSHTGADIGTGKVVLRTAGGFGTEYHAYQSLPEQITVSNLWVQAALFTTPELAAGKYVIHYRAQATNTSKKTVGFQVNLSEDALPFVEVEASYNAPVTANVYETRAAFEEFTLSADNIVNVQINFGQTTAGGTAKIKGMAVYLFRVGDL